MKAHLGTPISLSTLFWLQPDLSPVFCAATATKRQVRSAAAQHTAVGAEMHRLCQESQVQSVPRGILGAVPTVPSEREGKRSTGTNWNKRESEIVRIKEKNWRIKRVTSCDVPSLEKEAQREALFVGRSGFCEATHTDSSQSQLLHQVCCEHPEHQCLKGCSRKCYNPKYPHKLMFKMSCLDRSNMIQGTIGVV